MHHLVGNVTFSASKLGEPIKVYVSWRTVENKKHAADIQKRNVNLSVKARSKVNLDVKILLCIITHLVDPEIRKMLGKGLYGNQDSTFHSGP